MQSISVILAAIKAYYYSSPPLDVVQSDPLPFPLPATPTLTLDPTGSYPLHSLAGPSTTALHDFIEPLQFAAIVIFALVASGVLIAAIWSMAQKAMYYCFGPPAKGVSKIKGCNGLLATILTVSILPGAQYACSCLGLDYVQLAPLSFIGNAILGKISQANLSFKLISGPLKHSFIADFTAVANGVRPNSHILTRIIPFALARVPMFHRTIPQVNLTVDPIFGPLKHSIIAVLTAAANGVRPDSRTLTHITLFAVACVPTLSHMYSVDLNVVLGPLKHSFAAVFTAAARAVSVPCVFIHTQILVFSQNLRTVDLGTLLGPLKHRLFAVLTAAASGVQSVSCAFIRATHLTLNHTMGSSRKLRSVDPRVLLGPLHHGFVTVCVAAACRSALIAIVYPCRIGFYFYVHAESYYRKNASNRLLAVVPVAITVTAAVYFGLQMDLIQPPPLNLIHDAILLTFTRTSAFLPNTPFGYMMCAIIVLISLTFGLLGRLLYLFLAEPQGSRQSELELVQLQATNYYELLQESHQREIHLFNDLFTSRIREVELSDQVRRNARSYHDLEERCAFLEDEVRQVTAEGLAPPNCKLSSWHRSSPRTCAHANDIDSQAIAEGAFDEWSASVVSGTSAFTAPAPAPAGAAPACEFVFIDHSPRRLTLSRSDTP
ncbi:hypothetical protein DXG01_009041 [Tephrocybe rancida]|nr:hypothetical protein DXG01_009041 [Tephrocybe rancida]